MIVIEPSMLGYADQRPGDEPSRPHVRLPWDSGEGGVDASTLTPSTTVAIDLHAPVFSIEQN
jgi:hypothetical protein